MSYGVTDQGFKNKTYNTIVSDMETRAKSLFGENISLTERSPLGIFIRIVSWFLGILWQLAENVYYSPFVDTADGVQLDRVAKNIGIRRQQATKATGKITISGDDEIIIASGFTVATSDDVQFVTTEDVQISSGSATASIEAIVAGISGNVPTGTIIEIVNPTTGVDSITNSSDTTGGREQETDEDLRDRYNRSLAIGGSSTTASIEATLLDTEGVIDAIVDENDTNSIVNGIPPKSVAPTVYGGADSDVAQAIFETKAGGIQSFGDTIVSVIDSRGVSHDIGFSRPIKIDAYINITLTTNSDFPTDGNTQVQTEIIKYIGGTDVNSNIYDGLGLGEDVIFSKIIAVAHNIKGIEDITVEIGTDGISFSSNNISIGTKEYASTDNTKVVVS